MLSKYTQWLPIWQYETNCDCYLIQARRNLKDGFIQFNTQQIARESFDINLGLDPKIQFNKLINENKNESE